MATLPKHIEKFLSDYNIDHDEIWQVHGTSWVVKHKALERVAAEKKITFELPTMLEAKGGEKIVALCVNGKMGDRTEWSIGEAAPGNNKNAYPYAMAEKRAKDRVILKLLNSHGYLYSEDEADDFKQGAPRTTLPKKDAKDIYTKMQSEIRECQSREQLKVWGAANKERIEVMPEDWQDVLRLQYEEMLADLRNREAA